MEKVKEEKEKWDKIYESLKERDAKFVTDSEIPIKNLYTPLDLEDEDYVSDISFPGVPPYNCGVYP